MNEGYFFSLEGPLDSMPVRHEIRAGHLTGFGEVVRSLGGDPFRMLDQYGINPRVMHDPDCFLDSQSVVGLLEHCSRHFNDQLFGLRLAEYQDPDIFGSVATLCRSASTMREALNCFSRFIPVVHCPLVELEVVEGQDVAELRWSINSDFGQTDQARYKGLMMSLKLLRQIGGPSFRPNHIQLTTDVRRRDQIEIERRMGCTISGRAPSDAFAFPISMMSRPVASANRLLFQLLGGYLERVRQSSRRSIVERVEDYVRGTLSSGRCSIEHCSKRLGSSVRTLQSSLSDQGLRFSDILEQQRIEIAKSHLEAGELTLSDVASMLGYSEQSSFGRAFKRWTGVTPQHYRRRPEPLKAA